MKWLEQVNQEYKDIQDFIFKIYQNYNKYSDEEYRCPSCRSKLQYSLKKQVKGNNCGCRFPDKFQRGIIYKIYNYFKWRL